MDRLADWLRDEIAKTNIREVSERTGISTGTLSRIQNKELEKGPDLPTLVGLTRLGKPLAELVEMAGFDLGLPADDDAVLVRLRAEAASDAQLAEILDLLHVVSSADRRAVLTYLRGALGSPQ